MAGSIEVEGALWSAASWVFDWVLHEIAEATPHAQLCAKLSAIVDEGLGWLSLDDLEVSQRAEVTGWIRDDMLRAAAAKLPAAADVLRELRLLVEPD